MAHKQDEDSESVVEGVTSFVNSYVVPLQTKHEKLLKDPRLMYLESGKYAPEVIDLMQQVRMESATAGFYTAFCSESIGGGGMGFRSMLLTYEALHKRFGPHQLLVGATIAHWANGPSFLCEHFTDELKVTLLEGITSGQLGMCFAMSEPDAGSDAWMMRTTSTRDGDEWVINGGKQWITGSPFADYAYLFAVTDPEAYRERKGGVSCFVVPMDAPGVAVESVITLFGEIGGNEGILSFTEVRVPAINLVGELHQGFRLAMQGVGLGRIYNSGRSLGLAQWSLDIAKDYALSRQTFGKPIAEHQAVSFKLADSAIELFAARYAALELARRMDAGSPAVSELAIVKVLCVEMLSRVVDRSMQVCGGMGLTTEMDLYEAWHRARVLQIADGTGEILRRTVAQRLLASKIEF